MPHRKPAPTARPRHAGPAARGPAAAALPWAERRFAAAFFIILSLAAVLRTVSVVQYIRDSPLARCPLIDASVYWDWAGDIAAGKSAQAVPFFSAPLYPYLLGVLRAVGGSLPAVYVLQTLADLLTGALLAWVCRRRFGAGVGLLAAVLFFLLQEPASFALRVLGSSLHMLLVTVTWAVLVRAQGRPAVGWLVLVGLAAGVLCLAYTPALALVALIPAWLFLQSQRRAADLLRAVLPVALATLVIAPAGVHNWRASHEFFLIQSAAGITLRQGNHADSRGVYTPIPGISTRRDRMHLDAARIYRTATGKEPTWGAVDRYFRDQVLRDWRANPLWAAKLAASKLYRFVGARNYGDIYQPSAEIATGLHRWLLLAPLQVPWLIGPALLGLVLMLRRPVYHAPEWMLFLLPLVVTAVFFYSPRYRIPAVPIIVVAAPWALHRGLRWRAQPRMAVAVGGAVLGGVLLSPLNRAMGLDLLDPTNALFNTAAALQREGRIEAAVEAQRAGLKLKPTDTAARITLADWLTASGRYGEARAELTSVLQVAPESFEAQHSLGLIAAQSGDLNEARARLWQAVQRDPRSVKALHDLAVVVFQQGRPDEAAEYLRQALSLDPTDQQVRAALQEIEQLPATRPNTP